jgi:MYXO-CTERM domain-containing protein
VLSRAVCAGAALVAFLVAAAAPRARADCGVGADYDVTVDGSTVTVCTTGSVRRCGGTTIDLLRQDDADDAITVVAASSCSAQGCYVDACVPPGKYRYGYARSYDCSEAGCGAVSLFIEVDVPSPLSSTCAPASAAPATSTEAPPWGRPAAGTHPLRLATCGDPNCAVTPAQGGSVSVVGLLAVAGGLVLAARRSRRTSRTRSR